MPSVKLSYDSEAREKNGTIFQQSCYKTANTKYTENYTVIETISLFLVKSSKLLNFLAFTLRMTSCSS